MIYIWYVALAWWLVPGLSFPDLPHIYFLFTVWLTNERVGVFLARRSVQHLVYIREGLLFLWNLPFILIIISMIIYIINSIPCYWNLTFILIIDFSIISVRNSLLFQWNLTFILIIDSMIISVRNGLLFQWNLTFILIIDRKLQPAELPHNIYIQNYSTATATCITLRKWVFTLTQESFLNSDDLAINFLYWEVSNLKKKL